ncbi:MAG: hypothetical protein J6S85_12530 [Methanobrevibacter sp.]|nr:hypothetical protein [Methanobrevibacter sp.]
MQKMDETVVELLPESKHDVDETLEAKMVLDAVEAGNVTKEFARVILKDIDRDLEEDA